MSGRLNTLTPSKNSYDWLGYGVYFYEADSARAFKYAETSAKNLEQLLTAQAIGTPAVVGAVLNVERWLDITTQFGIAQFTEGLNSMKAGFKAVGKAIPANKPAFVGDRDNLHRALDKAVFENIHAIRSAKCAEAIRNEARLSADDVAKMVMGFAEFQGVLGAFQQGGALDAGSAIYEDSHIQLAIRDPECVLGWFLVPGDKLLADDAYADAKVKLAAAKRRKTSLKQRVKATTS